MGTRNTILEPRSNIEVSFSPNSRTTTPQHQSRTHPCTLIIQGCHIYIVWLSNTNNDTETVPPKTENHPPIIHHFRRGSSINANYRIVGG